MQKLNPMWPCPDCSADKPAFTRDEVTGLMAGCYLAVYMERRA